MSNLTASVVWTGIWEGKGMVTFLKYLIPMMSLRNLSIFLFIPTNPSPNPLKNIEDGMNQRLYSVLCPGSATGTRSSRMRRTRNRWGWEEDKEEKAREGKES